MYLAFECSRYGCGPGDVFHGDFNADGKSDLLWRDNSGTTASG